MFISVVISAMVSIQFKFLYFLGTEIYNNNEYE